MRSFKIFLGLLLSIGLTGFIGSSSLLMASMDGGGG